MATTPETAAPPAEPTDRAAALLERLKGHRQVLLGALAGLVLLAVVAWFMIESGRRKEAAASAMLENGWNLQDQGSLPEASAEFQRIIDTYRGTDASMQATLALNQIRLESGQAQLAADALREFLARTPPASYAAAGHRQLGTALEDLGQAEEAAAAYRQSATLATADHLKAEALLAAARAYRNAGNTEESVRALREITTSHRESGVYAEAMVRLAEITRGAM